MLFVVDVVDEGDIDDGILLFDDVDDNDDDGGGSLDSLDKPVAAVDIISNFFKTYLFDFYLIYNYSSNKTTCFVRLI